MSDPNEPTHPGDDGRGHGNVIITIDGDHDFIGERDDVLAFAESVLAALASGDAHPCVTASDSIYRVDRHDGQPFRRPEALVASSDTDPASSGPIRLAIDGSFSETTREAARGLATDLVAAVRSGIHAPWVSARLPRPTYPDRHVAWGVAEGTLPVGLALSPEGVFMGVPVPPAVPAEAAGGRPGRGFLAALGRFFRG